MTRGSRAIFGARLSALLRAHKISQESLARRMNVSAHAVRGWCHGNVVPDPLTLAELAAMLGVPVDFLFRRPGGS